MDGNVERRMISNNEGKSVDIVGLVNVVQLRHTLEEHEKW